MKTLFELFFDPRGKISSAVYVLALTLSTFGFVICAGVFTVVRFATPFQGRPFNLLFGLVFCVYLYQLLVETIKRLRDMGTGRFVRYAAKGVINLSYALAKWGLVAAGVAVMGLIWQAFQIPEQVTWSSTPRIVECSSPFGSWFNMNSLVIAPHGLVYVKSGFLGEVKTTIPYHKIRRVTFTDGQVWNHVNIATSRIPFAGKELYVKDDRTFARLRQRIQPDAGNRVIVEETRTILRRSLLFLRRRFR